MDGVYVGKHATQEKLSLVDRERCDSNPCVSLEPWRDCCLAFVALRISFISILTELLSLS